VTAVGYEPRASYDALAPGYDLLTAGHDHAGWAAQVEGLAARAGLAGRRLLDVGCGTGNVLAPMLARGYTATGADVSPGMLEIARGKLGGDVPLVEADMRALPAIGAFDLVWCLGDAVNHLLTDDELVATFTGFRRNLAPGGLVAFDVDTLRAFGKLYTSLIVVPGAERTVVFEGRAIAPVGSGTIAEAWIDRLEPAGDPWWERVRSVHRQRHHPRPTLERALGAAGLACVAAWGTDGDGGVEQPLDDGRHNKAVYIARDRKEVSDADRHHG
jgi:SAM-dependent methyltransferase